MDGFTIKNSERFLDSGKIRGDQALQVDHPNASVKDTGGLNFQDTLSSAINNVNQLQKASDKEMQRLSTGQTDNVADVMIAAEKADIALRLMVQVRNKMIDAYQEIMKMQV